MDSYSTSSCAGPGDVGHPVSASTRLKGWRDLIHASDLGIKSALELFMGLHGQDEPARIPSPAKRKTMLLTRRGRCIMN